MFLLCIKTGCIEITRPYNESLIELLETEEEKIEYYLSLIDYEKLNQL